MEAVKKYVVGNSYKDRAGKIGSDDQFSLWMNIPGSSYNNSAGIRPYGYVLADRDELPAYVVLVTVKHNKRTGNENYWNDEIDTENKKIIYWGDAQPDSEKTYEEFKGNKKLLHIDNALRNGVELGRIPPVLHFSKEQQGYSRFNGLCTIESIQVIWNVNYYNLQVTLNITDIKEVSLSWLHSRCKKNKYSTDDNQLNSKWYSCVVANELQNRKTGTVATISARLGQGKLREELLKFWDNKCSVTGCSLTRVLVASHIKPWRFSSDQERLDPFNALLLTPNLDALFDQGLITFSDTGKICISGRLLPSQYSILGINSDMRISKLEHSHVQYLVYHREHIFVY